MPTKAEKAAATKTVEDMVQRAPAQARAPSPVNGPLPEIPQRWQKAVERVFSDIEPEKDYERLEQALSLKDALSPGAIKVARNEAEANANEAHRLYVVAALEFERFTIDADVVQGALRMTATAELQEEKDAGKRSKAITDADVREKAALLFPEEWKNICERRKKVELALEQFKRLADLWKSRCFGLGDMIERH